MSEEKKKCIFCKTSKTEDSLNDRYLKDGRWVCFSCVSKHLDKMEDCVHCWLLADINKSKKELVKEKENYQINKTNFLGYENSEEEKKAIETISWLEKIINSRSKQLPELPCQKNILCGEENNKGFIGMKTCGKCGKYLMLNISFGDAWKSQDYYTHEQNCKQSDLNLDNQIKSNQIKSNQIKSNQIKSNQIKSNQSQSLGSNKSYLPYILGGIGVVALIGGLIWYFMRKK